MLDLFARQASMVARLRYPDYLVVVESGFRTLKG